MYTPKKEVVDHQANQALISPLLSKIVTDFRIRQQELNMSDKDLSEKSHVSLPVLSGLRSGKKTGVQFSTIEKIAEALDWEIEFEYKPKKG